MRVFFDTNVLLDVLLDREPFAVHARRAWSLAEQRRIEGMISVLTLPNIYYIARRAADRDAALTMVRKIRTTFELVACDEVSVDRALATEFADFEDAIQYMGATSAHADCILTRDAGHFPSDAIAVLAPEQFLALHSFN